MTRISRFGLILVGLYVLLSALCVAASFASSGDHKGSFVLLQLPIAFQASLVQAMGFADALRHLGWVGAYALFVLPTIILLYGFGAFIDRLAGRLRA